MSCPICKCELLTEDDSGFEKIPSFFLKYANPLNPIHSLINMGFGLIKVGKSIYYDFSSIQITYKYLWCPKCRVYYVRCPHCCKINIAGKSLETPLKLKCSHCNKPFVYMVEPTYGDESIPPYYF